MAKQLQTNPLIEEILTAKKIRTGRRPLSWLLFISMLTIGLLIPLGSSMYPQEAANYIKKHLAAEQAIQQLGKLNIIPPQAITAQDSTINKTLLSYTANTQNFRHTRSDQPTFFGLDKVWNPSHALDNAHKPWANDCKVCHSMPFVQVQDKNCLACHLNISDHVDRKTTTDSSWEKQKCANCHKEHNGEDGLAKQNASYMSQNCSSCHGDIKKSLAKTKTENVDDFATKHPEYRYQLALSSKPKDLQRSRLIKGEQLKESTALKFPHDVHLKVGGIKSPKGKIKVDCASCHKPNPDGLGFTQVTMKDNCQSCHDLKFEPAISNREVPHGSVELALSTLREFYSYVQVNTVPIDNKPLTSPIDLVRPGKDLPKVASFVHTDGNSRSRASSAATSLFEKTSCKVCHEVTRINEPGRSGTTGRDLQQWKVTPLTPAHSWLAQMKFDHAKHRMAECTDCHSANKSKKSTDVLMPEIKICRDCHTGSKPESNKLVSDCGLCHGFHMKDHNTSKGSPQQDTLASVIKEFVNKTFARITIDKPASALLNKEEIH